MNENEVMSTVAEEVTETITKPSGMSNGQAAVIGGVAAIILMKAAEAAYKAYQAHRAKKSLTILEQSDDVTGPFAAEETDE